MSPEALAERLVQAQDLETAFLGEEGVTAGLLVLTVPALSDAEDWAEITELYVQPSCGRRGVGRALVGAALEHDQVRDCTKVHLLVDPTNVTALSTYKALGFRRDSWEMRRPLQG